MKKRSSLFTFIVVVATLAAAAAIIVARLDTICEFLETCKRTAEEAKNRYGCCNGVVFSKEEESDFEDVEL